jgi:antiviral helicase SKI2
MSAAGGGGGGAASAERGQLQDLLQLLRKRDLLPVAVFTFSKKRCDIAADACSGMDLTTSAEKHTIHTFIQSVLSRLREGDRELPQVGGVRLPVGGGLVLDAALCASQ